MSEPPTRRPTVSSHLDDEVAVPTSLANLPWVDAHNHAHTLSWRDRERFAIGGCRAMVMVASGNHWMPYTPVEPDDVRYLWDDAINRRQAIERAHLIEARLALGVQTGTMVEGAERLIGALDAYCELDEVVAIGETGVRPTQQVTAWPLEAQLEVLEGQMAVAAGHDLPVILHTPSELLGPPRKRRPGLELPGYEVYGSLQGEPVLAGDDARLKAVRLDIEAADRAGLADDRVVASHADAENLPFLMEQTGCYASFTIGRTGLTGVSATDVAEAIDTYGPDRLMVDTDAANVIESDVLAIKRAIFELYRLGIDEDEIRRVVLENPMAVFELEG